ncbi:pyridoxal phosphate-dependent aminotransferase [Halotalea alkalilenta]|uniref:pyridoxal phosphate-dependent aminotransferase n=1 Tax=Halotalea alkalilenta TaxID=376489 RepID=UPI000487FFB7|nr:pyridoxal phosphate-dependent aminotransferase [Halotalea alkalilenta]
MSSAYESYGLSSRVAEMPENQIARIADLARNDPEVIKLWIGEGDLPTPGFINQAAERALKDGETRYTYSQGLPQLREALARYHQRHWNVAVDPSRFCITVGGMNALMLSLQMILEPGDEVITPTPAWPNSLEAIRILGGVNVTVGYEFDAAGGMNLPLDALFGAVTPRTRAIFINSPSNPTGWKMSREEMIQLRDFCRERRLWIIADEVYAHFVYDDAGVAPSFLEICAADDRLIVTNTFSKNWCMTGWRAGWAIVPEGLGALLSNLGQYNTTSIPTFIQHACVAALEQGDDFIRYQVERCRASRQVLVEGLSRLPHVSVFAPQGTFYLFFRLDGVSGESFEIARHILEQAKVGIAPGSAFGDGGEGYMRICFAIDPALAQQALERLTPCLIAQGTLSKSA